MDEDYLYQGPSKCSSRVDLYFIKKSYNNLLFISFHPADVERKIGHIQGDVLFELVTVEEVTDLNDELNSYNSKMLKGSNFKNNIANYKNQINNITLIDGVISLPFDSTCVVLKFYLIPTIQNNVMSFPWVDWGRNSFDYILKHPFAGSTFLFEDETHHDMVSNAITLYTKYAEYNLLPIYKMQASNNYGTNLMRSLKIVLHYTNSNRSAMLSEQKISKYNDAKKIVALFLEAKILLAMCPMYWTITSLYNIPTALSSITRILQSSTKLELSKPSGMFFGLSKIGRLQRYEIDVYTRLLQSIYTVEDLKKDRLFSEILFEDNVEEIDFLLL